MTNEVILDQCNALNASKAIDKASTRYAFINSRQVTDYLKSIGFMPVSYNEARANKLSKKGYTRHCIQFTHPDFKINDEVQARLIVLNSHDTGSALRLMVGIYRMVCANGLVVGNTWAEKRYIHIGLDLFEVAKGARDLIGQGNKLAEIIRAMVVTELSVTDTNAFLSDAVQTLLPNYLHNLDTLSQVNRSKRLADQGNSLWVTFNRVQEHILGGGISYLTTNNLNNRSRWNSTRRIKSLTRQVEVNQVLWNIALKYINSGIYKAA